MTDKSIKKRVVQKRIFCENPYDIETLFESLSIASASDKELIYMDRLVSTIRLDPLGDITTINYKILKELDLIKLKNI